MWCIRVYKRQNTGKIEGFKIVDEKTLEIKELSVSEIKQMLMFNRDLIANIQLDKHLNPVLRNMNPDKKIKYYKKSLAEEFEVLHYCIILGYNQGTMDFIADGITTNLVYGRNNTISEIATMLNIADTNKLNLFNGVVKIEGKRTAVYIYNNNTNSYRKLGSILTATNNNFGKDWDVEIEGVTQDGIRVKHIENIKGEWNSEIPLGISHIERFDGGVNNLKIPMSVKTLGEGCFSEVDDLHKVIFDKGVKTIPNSCFRYSSINSVVFSGCEQEIGEYAFDSCDKLSGALVTNVVNIKARAFCDTALTLVNLCKIEEIGIEAFAYCQKLRRVKLSNNLRVVKAGAFRYCKDLDSLFIPSSVEIIDKLAFEGCSKLREVKMSHNTRVFNNTFPKNTKVIYY